MTDGGDKEMTKTYIAVRDTLDPQGRFWFSGATRRLTPEQATPYIEQRKVALTADKPEPRRFVEIRKSDGSVENLTWGEYLRRKKCPKVIKSI